MKIDNSVYNFEEAEIVFAGAPLARSKTHNPLARKAPDLLRFSLNNKYDYDPLTGLNVFDELRIHDSGNAKNLGRLLSRRVMQKFFIIGGEHTITYDAVKVLNKSVKDLHVIIFDAHADARSKGEDNACFLRKIVDEVPAENIHLIGQRVFSGEEHEFMEEHGLKIHESLDLKNKNIYISFDIDVVDCVHVPTCSTPEPFGKSLEYYNDLLVKLCRNNNLISIDFVEFSGKEYDITYSNIASLIMNLLKTFLKE